MVQCIIYLQQWKSLYMGYSLEDIIDKVTKNAADAISLKIKV